MIEEDTIDSGNQSSELCTEFDVDVDGVLLQLAKRQNRKILVDELHRRINDRPNAYDVAHRNGIPSNVVEPIVDCIEMQYPQLAQEDDSIRAEDYYCLIEAAYGEMADRLIHHV